MTQGVELARRVAGHHLDGEITVEVLSGGAANAVFRCTASNSRAIVVKTADRTPADLFGVEAEGLRALDQTGGLRVPAVLEVATTHLVLEALSASVPDQGPFWERAGRAVARLHQQHGEQFGWPHDGWLGQLPQINRPTDDGHQFFAEHRLLRFLGEPRVAQSLSPRTRQLIERIAGRLDQLVPCLPAVLTHGDLWRNNIVATSAGEPAFIDPAVCWMWAEADLSMAWCTGGLPERFFLAYQEIQPLDDGWQERAELLNLRELLSVVAHFGLVPDCVAQIDATARRFGE